MATLSTNSLHRVAYATTHASLLDDETDAAAASQAIRDVVVLRPHRPPPVLARRCLPAPEDIGPWPNEKDILYRIHRPPAPLAVSR